MIKRTIWLTIALAAAGCCGSPPVPDRVATATQIETAVTRGLTAPVPDDSLKAVVVPPVGWKPEPPKVNEKHRHQIWLSPSGNTAYGVIYFKLPLPVGLNITLDGFMKQMKDTEGEGTLIERKDDDQLPGIRFTAAGGEYLIQAFLVVDGFHGWVVYAGTKQKFPTNEAELRTAIDARDQTRVDLR
jgi:hypothetical protein